ncbi:MAG TPA: hypothetical protein DCZ76_08850 [Treponema sp.]|nr:hypothetical protein [Treponema sp.]
MLATRCASNGAGRDPRNPASATHKKCLAAEKIHVLKGSAAKKKAASKLGHSLPLLANLQIWILFL